MPAKQSRAAALACTDRKTDMLLVASWSLLRAMIKNASPHYQVIDERAALTDIDEKDCDLLWSCASSSSEHAAVT